VVEPADSAVISGECPGYHRIQGIGEGFVPDLYQHEDCDGIIKVTDVEAKANACRLARLEGIFAGYSAGANIFASLKVARELGKGKTVVTVIPDSGMKYLSTELFHHSPEVCTIHCCTLEKPEMRKECQKGAVRCCVLDPCYVE
jgi:cysteine synthase A